MASKSDLSLCVSDFNKEKYRQGKNGKFYYDVTVSTSDETNSYGQNVSVIEKQTKEERTAEKKPHYLGNGGTFWTTGTISLVEKINNKKASEIEVTDDLSF